MGNQNESWTEYLSAKHQAVVKAITDDKGDVLSKVLLGSIFHGFAEFVLKRASHKDFHAEIERVFGFNVGLIPGNHWHDAKKAADSVVVPLMQSTAEYVGLSPKRIAEKIEEKFLTIEQKMRAYGRNK